MANEKPYCIVTEDDAILVKDLTLAEAEQRLCRLLNRGEDCYIGETEAYTVEIGVSGERLPIPAQTSK
ncbi:hypothetical protein [Pseudoalteromonas luteoviolacea]|jgi:hypothetical protein|uniref:hypothetical protein n=1 Tax=Pseudoalteromonas luteoviolacea TaxID=43657 RepID=UPI001B359B3D|nr:hypothetical protein [Pseudoalteromonas luteoviolacea]MBQ4840164.1 hypothetical protein [Pseudoalteromonas luteoviolacea]